MMPSSGLIADTTYDIGRLTVADTAIVVGGHPISGFDIGIVTLKTRHPLIVGNVQNARSFNAPVLYEVLDLTDFGRLMAGDRSLVEEIVAAARRLESAGVRAIVGACGSFAYFQEDVARAVQIPVFMSIMVQCPFLLSGLGAHKKLCVIFASSTALTENLIEACGISNPSRLVVKELRGWPEFDKILSGVEEFYPENMQAEVLQVAQQAIVENPDIGAFLIQCSDLPPFSPAIQRATGKPVFDMIKLVNWLQSSIH